MPESLGHKAFARIGSRGLVYCAVRYRLERSSHQKCNHMRNDHE
jgi:hypothetical protein